MFKFNEEEYNKYLTTRQIKKGKGHKLSKAKAIGQRNNWKWPTVSKSVCMTDIVNRPPIEVIALETQYKILILSETIIIEREQLYRAQWSTQFYIQNSLPD